MAFCGMKQFWILVLPCFILLRETSTSRIEEDVALAKMKHQWEECCRSNKTLCVKASCYSMEWRAAAWAAVRSRCRGRYSDWPFAVDIMKVQEEKDIEAVWKLLSIANAYPNQSSALPVTVWTSGTRCPQRGPSGIIVSTKWASNEPFPSWLEENVNHFSPVNDTSSDESCKFMVITPKSKRTATFHFDDENSKHAAICEFFFPEKTDWTNSVTISDALTTPVTTRLPNCTADSTDPTTCEEEENKTQTTFTILTSTNATSDRETLTGSITPEVFTNDENSSADSKKGTPTTDTSYSNETETTTPLTDSTTESTIDSASESTTDTATKSTTDPATKSIIDPTTASTTDPATESTTDPATESTTDPATASTTDPATASTTDPATESTTDTATESITDPATESTTDPATKSTTDPTTTTSTTDPATESTTDPATESTTDSATESIMDPTTASITDPATESTTGSVTGSSVHSITASTVSSSEPTFVRTTTESETGTTKDLNSVDCKERNESGIKWPATPPGETANQSCPEGMTGYAQWKCDEKTLTFIPDKPSIHHCRHIWIDALEDEINADGNAVEISSKLANKTKDSTLSHGDIAAVVELAENLIELFARQKNEKESSKFEMDQISNMTYNFTKSFVATYSNVLRSEHNNAWNDLPEIRQRVVASKILRHTETVGQVLSCSKMTENNLQYTVLEDNINLQTFMFNSSEKRSIPYVFPRLGPEVSSTGKIVLPVDLTPDLWPPSCPDAKTAVGIVYKNVGQFLKEEFQENNDSNVNSPVLGLTLGNSSGGSIKLSEDQRVTIFLKHTTQLNKRSTRYTAFRCVFWNFSRGSYGDWDDSGCYVGHSNFSHTVCICDHLTNFAILMDVNNKVKRDDFVLELMTYVCCGLSAVALTLTLICLIGIRSLHCRRNSITSNLCVCLLVMNVIVVFGLDRTENEILCAVIAGFLQYSLLSAFCWMLLEAYQLYQMVILVFCSSTQISMVYFYLFGYGIPLVIVGTSAGMRHEDYGGPDVCWLSNENGLMWSFAGPACFAVLVNLIVFIMTIKSASSVKIRKEQKTVDKVKSWVKGSFSILCLLGLTWVTGLLYIIEGFYFASYIFITLNGLQGVFIFIFHVLLNEKTGTFFRRIFKKKMIVRQTTKSTVLNGTSSNERRRTQVQNGTSEHCNVRRSGSSSQQNSCPSSVSSNSVPSNIGQVISNSQDMRGCLHYQNRLRPNGLRMKSLAPDSSKDTPHSGGARGVIRHLQRSHH